MRKLSLADFLAYEHVMVISPGTGHGEIDKLMERKGVERRVRVTVPHSDVPREPAMAR